MCVSLVKYTTRSFPVLRFEFSSADTQLRIRAACDGIYGAYLDRELSAERFVGIRAANEEAIGTLPAEHSYVVLALVVVAPLQVTKLAMRLGAGPLQSLKQAR